MARLRCAVKDGHPFILPGPNYGTCQITPEGLETLKRYGITLPHAGDAGVHIDTSLWRYLKSNGQLFKLGIPYDAHKTVDGSANEDSPASLPLLLNLNHHSDLIRSWSLTIELTSIPEEIQVEAQERRAVYLSVSDLLAKRTYLNQHLPVSVICVAPQSPTYEVAWFDTSGRRLRLDATCYSDGLSDTALGNVFAEINEHIGRRCPPGSGVAFWGTLYWLAVDGYSPGWPGIAQQWGVAQDGWRLWSLTTSAEQPVSWQAIAGWLNERSLTLTHHTQHLHLVTPPLAITQDGWSLVNCDQPLIIGCTLPGRVTSGVRAQLQLTITRFDGGRDIAVDVAPGLLQDAAPDETWFARWTRPQPGDYRIQAFGGATVEPLRVRVLPDASAYRAKPAWLQGLACRLTADDHSETLTAFAESEHPRVTTFSEVDLPYLQWELQPEGLPVWVSWRPDTESADGNSLPVTKMDSGEELTTWWYDTIWPNCASARGAQLVIEGDSFGRIECVIGLPLCDESADRWIRTTEQRAELTWLVQLSLAPSTQPRIPLPADLRLALSRLYMSASQTLNSATITAAVTLLRAQQTIPAWIVPRVRALIAAEPAQSCTSSACSTSLEASRAL